MKQKKAIPRCDIHTMATNILKIHRRKKKAAIAQTQRGKELILATDSLGTPTLSTPQSNSMSLFGEESRDSSNLRNSRNAEDACRKYYRTLENTNSEDGFNYQDNFTRPKRPSPIKESKDAPPKKVSKKLFDSKEEEKEILEDSTLMEFPSSYEEEKIEPSYYPKPTHTPNILLNDATKVFKLSESSDSNSLGLDDLLKSPE